jgi:hypothetical protein
MQVSNSNYNGDFLEFLYGVLFVGNQVIEKGSARVLTGIAKTRALPKVSQTESPFGDYTSGAPGSDTVTTTYAERELDPQKMTLYEEFLPEDWQDVWEKWQPIGDFTNLMMNPAFMADVIELYMNNGGTQLSKLFWQGDTTLGAANALNKFNGIITRAIADASVVDVTPAGNITKSNVVDIVEAVWAAIDDKYIDDPDYMIHMSTTNFKMLQQFNNDAKKTTVGVLSEDIQDLFLNKRIVHYSGFPSNYVLGAKGMADSDVSNLFFGFYVEFTNENPRINYVANAGRNMFIRYDIKADANYREATELVLYQPV